MPNKTRKKIAVVTGTRAEYGILKPLLEKIKSSKNFDLRLLVTGMHLLKKYGLTLNEIKKDGFKIDVKIPMYAENELGPGYHARALANGIKGFTLALMKIKPDAVLIFGDRLEPLAAVLAAAVLKIPVGHIHGGDKTDSGHIDESTRHAITKFSHLHFPPTLKAEQRLIKMGEERRRIFRVGSLGLDSLVNQPFIKKEILFKKLGLDLKQKLIIVLFHPVHLEAAQMGGEAREIIKALKVLKIQAIILYPNNDAGGRDIIKEINKIKNLPFIKIVPNLPHEEYLSLLKCADALLGNSSSGLLEAPSLKLAAVNIGSRNTGREHGENVIFVRAKKTEIIKAARQAFNDKNFKQRLKKSANPYGDGKTSARIIKILKQVKLDKKLLLKKLTY